MKNIIIKIIPTIKLTYKLCYGYYVIFFVYVQVSEIRIYIGVGRVSSKTDAMEGSGITRFEISPTISLLTINPGERNLEARYLSLFC